MDGSDGADGDSISHQGPSTVVDVDQMVKDLVTEHNLSLMAKDRCQYYILHVENFLYFPFQYYP